MGTIYIEGIKVYAYHGVLYEENKIGCYYNIDITIKTCLLKASTSDNLDDTINYVRITDIVQNIMKTSVKLLEYATHKINTTLIESFPQIKHIKTKLSKINPPVNGEVKQISIILEQEN